MTEPTWHTFGRALLGSWPSQVTNWGEEGIAAYVAELQQRGVGPEAAVVALRMCDGRWPPSAGDLAKLAHRDPSRPTADECFAQLYGPGGVFGFKRSGVTVSPWVLAFVEYFGRERLRVFEVDDPAEGKWRRRELTEAWERFVEVSEGREVAALASGRRGAVGRFDPLSALRPVPELEEGSDAD